MNTENEWLSPEQELLIKQTLDKPVGVFIISSSGEQQNEAEQNLVKLANTQFEKESIVIENLIENPNISVSDVLKKDPDVVIMGEVKDEASVKDMTTLALSGHKVFTTVSSSAAFSVVNRLEALGINNSDIGEPDFINGVLHQIGFDKLTKQSSISFDEYKVSSDADKNIIECVNDLFMPDEIQDLRFRKSGEYSTSGERIYVTEFFPFTDRIREELKKGNKEKAYSLYEQQSYVSFDSKGDLLFTGAENTRITAFEAVRNGVCDIREVYDLLSIVKR